MENVKPKIIIEPKEHHKVTEKCLTRPPYRNGKKLTAVRVYTINDESTHLLIFGVPKLKLENEVKRLCHKFGVVKKVKPVPDYPDVEEFTEVYHVHYLKLSSAKYARTKLKGTSFFGSVLQVVYAPELESVEETRAKLVQRRKYVHFQLNKLKQSATKSS